MKKVVIFLIALTFIFLSQNIFASINVSNSSMSLQYNPNSTISGWMTLNISNESANSSISTSANQNISLINFINAQNFSLNSNYTCFPSSDCNYSYITTDSGSPTEQFHLNAGESKIFGISITGSGVSVFPNSFSLNVTSNAQESNVSQLSIDLLNDNVIEWSQYNSSGNLGSTKYYGCYSPSLSPSGLYKITSVNYCEKIDLSSSPAINIGADINGSGVSDLILSIQNFSNFNPLGSCTTSQNPTGEINCIATNNLGNPLSISSGDYYVCIKTSANNVNDNYYINYQAQSPFCGIFENNLPPYTPTTNYEIFALPENFASLNSFILNTNEARNSGYNGNPLETEISSYISSSYNKNCINGCVIPIKFTANVDQDINLSNLSLEVTTDSGVIVLNNLSNVMPIFPTYNTIGFQNFSLDAANFSVPNTFGPSTFVLSFNDNTGSYQLLSNSISIMQSSQIVSVNPTITTAAFPTNFNININNFGSGINVTSYQWNFGDGSGVETTSTNNITYTYNQLGDFNLQVTAINSLGLTSIANFTIDVISPKDAVNQLLIQDSENLQNIQNQINNFSVFSKNSLNQTLNLWNISQQLYNLDAANSTASSDNEYITIMNQLESINLPNSIFQTQSVSIPFFQSKNNIDLNALKSIGGGTYDSSRQDDYISAIVSSDLSNVSTTINYEEFSAAYGQIVSSILNIVELDIKGPGGYYLVIPSKFSNLQFENNLQKSSNYYYTPLTGSLQTIRFATTDLVSPSELPIFIAPSLDQIVLASQTNTGMNKYVILALIVGGIALVILVIVLLTIKWYRNRYESYLFKDRNDLYNIINYIHSSKSKGTNNKDIEKSLRKSKWSSEQIDYVMKRYAKKK